MYVNVDCGICGSCINIDSEWEESSWMMLFRFADAHVDCGTFTPPISSVSRLTELSTMLPTAVLADKNSTAEAPQRRTNRRLDMTHLPYGGPHPGHLPAG